MYPQYDSWGTIMMVIFDSGVDPEAPGLEVTSDGKLKVIEKFDCSRWGDIDTSKVSISLSNMMTAESS